MLYFSLLLLLVILCCVGAGVPGKGKLFENYMSKERTTSIKGVFAVIIVMSHMLQYIGSRLTAPPDAFAKTIIIGIGQLMVIVFFFYSGYGIMESLRRKPDYMRSFFRTRILKTLTHFDLAILLFIIVNTLLGKHYPIGRTLLAFTGWTSVGNSNWFVFCTLALYIVTLLAFGTLPRHKDLALITVALLTAVLILLLRAAGKDSWWYNTLPCYPLGMLWSSLSPKLVSAFKKRIWLWWASLLLGVGGTAALAVLLTGKSPLFSVIDRQAVYMLFSCVVCGFIAVSQMRLRTNNKVLYWLGVNSFGIYILQRLPMNILKHFGLHARPEIFIPVSLAAALLIAPAFTWLTGRVDKLLFSKKTKADKG